MRYKYVGEYNVRKYSLLLSSRGAWGSVVVKALRYWSDDRGIDSRCCQWGFFSVFPPTKPCALRSTQPLKVSTRDFSWGKGGRCVWLTTYHPCSAETSRKSGVLAYPEPLGPPRPVAGNLHFLHFFYFLQEIGSLKNDISQS